MATWRVNNSTALGGEVCSPWQADHTYATGARCVCTLAYATTAARAFVYEITSGGGGKSHATTQPTWPTTVGNTVVDGDVTWTCRSPGDGTWDNASCFLTYVLNYTAINAAADIVLIDDGHSEATDFASTRIILKGSTSSSAPLRIFCVDKSDDSISVGALVKSTGTIWGMRASGYGYSYGVTYEAAGEGIKVCDGPGNWCFESDNQHDVLVVASDSLLMIGANFGDPSKVTVKNGGINLKGTGSYIKNSYGEFHWLGGSLTAASGVTKLFDAFANVQPRFIVKDVDLSAVGTANYIFDCGDAAQAYVSLERCKLPTGAFTPYTGTRSIRVGGSLQLHHCSSGNAVYDVYQESYEGVSEDSTSIYNSSGASDGTTDFSIKMVSSASCLENIIALESPPIHGWTSSTTETTFTIEGVWDSATNIQDDEIWMELEYPADNSSGLGAIAKDKCAVLGTPADQTASTATWTGTDGFSNENKFKLSVTVTPGKAGPITARVYLAKASTTVYIDPMITES